jgi:hypothetical protein
MSRIPQAEENFMTSLNNFQLRKRGVSSVALVTKQHTVQTDCITQESEKLPNDETTRYYSCLIFNSLIRSHVLQDLP